VWVWQSCQHVPVQAMLPYRAFDTSFVTRTERRVQIPIIFSEPQGAAMLHSAAVVLTRGLP